MRVLADKKYMIIGAGLTGLSVARWCVRQGYAFDICDTRTSLTNEEAIKAEFSSAKLYLGELNAQQLVQYQTLVVSPGVALTTPAIAEAAKQGVQVTGDIQLFAEHRSKPIVAITGSNGKTTVTTLVGQLLAAAGKQVAVGGNIGTPALDLGAADVYVLELSSFQLETTPNLNAEVAVVLNISADHMDRYPSIDAYIAAKQRIFNGCKTAVFNRHEAVTQPKAIEAASSFACDAPQGESFGLVEKHGKTWLAQGDTTLVATNDLKLKGKHNLLNAAAALALVHALGVDVASVISKLKAFPGLPFRCQWLGRKQGVEFYNDSKGTNVGATLAAVEGLGKDVKGKIWLMLGGVSKGQDFTQLAQVCQRYIAEVQVYGADRKKITNDLEVSCNYREHETLEQAFKRCLLLAAEGDVILFSPACASFDQFENYIQRGEYFNTLVEAVL